MLIPTSVSSNPKQGFKHKRPHMDNYLFFTMLHEKSHVGIIVGIQKNFDRQTLYFKRLDAIF